MVRRKIINSDRIFLWKQNVTKNENRKENFKNRMEQDKKVKDQGCEPMKSEWVKQTFSNIIQQEKCEE